MSQECTEGRCCTTTGNTNCNSGDECCDLPEKLIALADEAWYEVVKAKLKKEIESSCGDKLDKLAKIVAETNNKRWAHKIEGKVTCEEYKNSIKDLFVSCATDKS